MVKARINWIVGALTAAIALGGSQQVIAAEGSVAAADGPKTQFWARRETGYFPAADGTLLRYSVLLPAKTGRFPVALIYSGYDTGSIGGSAYLKNDVTFSADLDAALVKAGYAVMGVNARATGCSEGSDFRFLGPKYGEDGKDAIEFAAAQSWSNGKVGMFGWSWAGMSQLATASNQPPHLRAIAPGMVLGDQRLDNSAPGGVTAYAMADGWRLYVLSRWDAVEESAKTEGDTRCLEQLKKNRKTESQGYWGLELIRHPVRDQWTEDHRLNTRTHLITVPVLSIEAFQDEATTSREGYYQETLNPDRTWLLQSNGPHDIYESLELRKVLVAFLDRFVKDSPNGFERQPHLTVWLDTRSAAKTPHARMQAASPTWRFSKPEVSPTVAPLTLSLSGHGRLVIGPGEGEPDEYVYPTAGPSVNTEWGAEAWGPMSDAWKKGTLAYTSDPLARDILVYGPASADVWVASSAPDADIQVTITQLQLDGSERYIQRGWLRLSDRALDTQHSGAVRPILIDWPESFQILRRDEPVLARVEINKFAALFSKGSRIRIWIDAPSPTGLYQFSDVTWPAKNHVWHDAAHPSRLVLGELTGVTVPTSLTETCAALSEPCRSDPLRSSE